MSFVEKGRTSTVDADFVVCGLPFSILRSIDISPQLPADKTATIKNLRYMPVGRNFMQTRSRFWTQRGIGGLKIARTDTGIDRLWHNTDVQDGATSIVGAYMQNQTGVDYAAAGSNFAQRTAYVKGIVSTFFPEIGAEYLGGVEKIWQNDPYVKGAWDGSPPANSGCSRWPSARKGASTSAASTHRHGAARCRSIRVCEPRRQRDQ